MVKITIDNDADIVIGDEIVTSIPVVGRVIGINERNEAVILWPSGIQSTISPEKLFKVTR